MTGSHAVVSKPGRVNLSFESRILTNVTQSGKNGPAFCLLLTLSPSADAPFHPEIAAFKPHEG
jgi:hypothetical protein